MIWNSSCFEAPYKWLTSRPQPAQARYAYGSSQQTGASERVEPRQDSPWLSSWFAPLSYTLQPVLVYPAAGVSVHQKHVGRSRFCMGKFGERISWFSPMAPRTRTTPGTERRPPSPTQPHTFISAWLEDSLTQGPRYYKKLIINIKYKYIKLYILYN